MRAQKRDISLNFRHSWHDLEPVLGGLVTAFMSTRFPKAVASKLTSLLLDQYLTVNLKAWCQGLYYILHTPIAITNDAVITMYSTLQGRC